MKKAIALLLITILFLSFCLTSCGNNEEYKVLIDEKDVTIDGKNTIELDDLYSWFDFINEDTCSQLDENNKFYLDTLDITFFLCENNIEAHRYYMIELIPNSELFDRIILRINNMVIFNDIYTARRPDFIQFLNFFEIDIEKSERIIEKDYLIEYINNYDEKKLLDYFMNNDQYDCFMAKNGDPGLYYNLDSVEYGYVITNKTKNTYLVLDHYLTKEEYKALSSDIERFSTSVTIINSAKSDKVLGLFLYHKSKLRSYYSMGYNLYDDANIIWSDDIEWIELVKNILSSEG